jgi:hypothetical protein
MDGYALYQNLSRGAGFDVPGLTQTHNTELADANCGSAFIAWVKSVWMLPSGADNNAWDPSRFEYTFGCAAADGEGENKLAANQYTSGKIDWYVFDVDPGAPMMGVSEPPMAFVRSTMPTPVSYAGMPQARWWAMEDGRTNFGAIRPDTTDLIKLLFIEFGLMFSNDWFLVPITVPAGSVVSVKGLIVTDAFGARLWIDAVDAGAQAEDSRFSLFALTKRGSGAPDPALLLPADAVKVQEGAPFEDVMLIRDEMANTVWAIEKTVPAPEGRGAAGADAGRETRAYLQRFAAPSAPAGNPSLDDVKLRYDLMTEIPEHWIPFVSTTESGVQRGTMIRLLSALDMEKIRPRTSLLRPGLDMAGRSFVVPQEEVPRAGARVTQSFQRTRWTDGRSFVWIAARKKTGRGEGWSGLAFDRVVPKEAPGSASGFGMTLSVMARLVPAIHNSANGMVRPCSHVKTGREAALTGTDSRNAAVEGRAR